MRIGGRVLAVLIFLLSGVAAWAADDWDKKAVWITGDVVEKGDVLFFRTDKPVVGNSQKNLVLLGATRQTADMLLPMYMKAAEKKVRLRLYGMLVPFFEGTVPNHKGELPNVQFITWKVHMPDEPDELPNGEKILIKPGEKMPGYKVEQVK